MKEFLEYFNLNVDANNEFWLTAFAKAKEDCEIPFFVSREYLEKIQTEYGVFPKNFELLLSVVDDIKQDKNLCFFAKVLYHLLAIRVQKDLIFGGFELPTPRDNDNALAYQLFSVFPILAYIPESYNALQDRGVDKEVCTATHCQLDTCISESSVESGKPCFTTDYFLSYGAFIFTSTLRIGRFRFQLTKNTDLGAYLFENKDGQLKVLMNGVTLDKEGYVLGALGHENPEGSFVANVSEDETCYTGYAVDSDTYLAQTNISKLNKKEWKLIYKPMDDVVMVHIPYAESFDSDYCERSYQKAREVLKKCYPEYDFKCFATSTWFLSPILDKVLKPTSNIYHFRKKYSIFPTKSRGLDVFDYVYNVKAKDFYSIDINALKEDNSLRKGVKEQLLKGEFVHEAKGVFKF